MEALFYVLFWVAVGLGIANLVISIQKRRKRRREEKEKIYIDLEDRQFFFRFGYRCSIYLARFLCKYH